MNLIIYIATLIIFSPLKPTILKITIGKTVTINEKIFTYKLLKMKFTTKYIIPAHSELTTAVCASTNPNIFLLNL